MAKNRVCAIDGCCKAVIARGWCAAHYRKWQLHRDPLGSTPRKAGPVRTWVETVAVPFQGEDCLPWPFFCNDKGYAAWTVDGRPQPAARVICEMVNGAPPSPAHVAAHSCFMGHMGCVNPKHLRWATQSENEMDKVASGTSNRGERHGLSKLTEDEVRRIKADRSVSADDFAARYGVSRWTIFDIRSGRRWGHVSA